MQNLHKQTEFSIDPQHILAQNMHRLITYLYLQNLLSEIRTEELQSLLLSVHIQQNLRNRNKLSTFTHTVIFIAFFHQLHNRCTVNSKFTFSRADDQLFRAVFTIEVQNHDHIEPRFYWRTSWQYASLSWRRPIESWFNVIVVLNFVGACIRT